MGSEEGNSGGLRWQEGAILVRSRERGRKGEKARGGPVVARWVLRQVQKMSQRTHLLAHRAALPCTLPSSSRVRLSLQVTSKDFKAFSLSILILAGGKVSSERRFSHDSLVGQKLSTHTCCRTAVGRPRDNTHPASGHRRVTSAVLRGKPPHLCARALPPRTPAPLLRARRKSR